MKLLDLTLPTPEENLACDEALLEECDDGAGPSVLRFWEPVQHFVVVGYSNRVKREVNVAACHRRQVPILRRCTGGGTVLQGPGCLNYSLILRMDSRPALQTVTGTNRLVMERNCGALEGLIARGRRSEVARFPNLQLATPNVQLSVRGHTDLAISGRKFSGNAQRRKRSAVLFHGTFLLDFDLVLVSELLPMPSKQPDYRDNRGHGEFLTNLNVSAPEVKAALRLVWEADALLDAPPMERTQALAVQKYGAREWNFRSVA